MEKRLLGIVGNGPLVMPAVVVSVGGWDTANLITLAYVGKVAAEPHVLSISIRPSRHSFSLIEELGEFEQAEEMYVALKRLKREVEFVRFPEENHDLSRAGRPDRRVARLDRIAGFLAKYLKP